MLINDICCIRSSGHISGNSLAWGSIIFRNISKLPTFYNILFVLMDIIFLKIENLWISDVFKKQKTLYSWWSTGVRLLICWKQNFFFRTIKSNSFVCYLIIDCIYIFLMNITCAFQNSVTLKIFFFSFRFFFVVN